MNKIEKLTRVPLKNVWKYEDRNLTPWLCENIDVISDEIGIQLTNAEIEQSTGSFNVDIKAEDENSDVVVIENQYGSSDHKHLGQLITYLTSFSAKIAIWIVEHPKQEHINAINWLNQLIHIDFHPFSHLLLAICKSNTSNPHKQRKLTFCIGK